MKGKPLIQDLLSCLILVVIAFGAGVAANAFRSDPLSLKYTRPAERLDGVVSSEAGVVNDWEPGLHLIDLEQMRKIVDAKSALIVDGRPDLFFEFGHVPGAQNLARKNFDADYERLEKWLKPAKEGGIPLVIYCADRHCEDSGKMTKLLQDREYPVLLLFEGGYKEWESAGLPIVEGK